MREVTGAYLSGAGGLRSRYPGAPRAGTGTPGVGRRCRLSAHPPAGLRLRIVAFIYDYAIIAGYLVLLGGAGAAVLSSPAVADKLFTGPFRGQVVGFFLVTAPVCLYFIIMECSAAQGTRGKVRQGIYIAGADGAPPGVFHIVVRTVLKFLPWELSHLAVWHMSAAADNPPSWTYWVLAAAWLLVMGNLVSVWLSPAGQALYDRVAGSIVVRGKPRGMPVT